MTVHTAEDILAEARYFHHHLKVFYQALEHKVERPKVRLILEYLCRHEERMENMLAEYRDDITAKISHTWFKHMPGDSIDAVIASVDARPDMTLDVLLIMAMKFEDCFINLYRHVADQAVSVEVKEVFETLEKESIKDRTNLARNLVNMQDL
ncbi:MAG: hypothetical protein KDL10_00555 [Kiritimatiellae bacterium]|nr:hypothetical protein [Kiritimatiellia bacterium]